MEHAICYEGFAFRLRPVTRADAPLILRLRSDPRHCRYLHAIVPTLEAQEQYLEAYFRRDGDYYFVVEGKSSGTPEGLIAIYDVDTTEGCAEIGRWVLRPGSPAAVESICLLYGVAFEVLALREVCCRTVAENRRAVSFHDSCGLRRRATLAAHVTLADGVHDQIEHVLSVEEWPAVRARLEQLARSAA